MVRSQIVSPAKVNLCLDVTGHANASGFHSITTLIYKVPFMFDELILERSEAFRLTCFGYPVPADETNTVYKALELLGDTNWNVTLTKRILPGSGLGGGSSNAASVLKHVGGLQGKSDAELLDVGERVGMDVPAFLTDGNLVFCIGRGEKVVESWTVPEFSIEVVDTGISILTEEAYAELDLSECGRRTGWTNTLVDRIRRGDFAEMDQFCHNDFEASFRRRHSDGEFGADMHLCGSGGWGWRFGT